MYIDGMLLSIQPDQVPGGGLLVSQTIIEMERIVY